MRPLSLVQTGEPDEEMSGTLYRPYIKEEARN
jgi:hypothetical protein